MQSKLTPALFILASACSVAGCSGSGLPSLTTSSVTPATTPTTVAAAPKADPACIALSAKIESLRRDGVTERVEKASVGKGTNVSVKRTSLAQMAELDKANAEFQQRCAMAGLKPAPAVTAAVPPGAASVGAPAPSTGVVTTRTAAPGGAPAVGVAPTR